MFIHTEHENEWSKIKHVSLTHQPVTEFAGQFTFTDVLFLINDLSIS